MPCKGFEKYSNASDAADVPACLLITRLGLAHHRK
jgi:hypothetical protein